jgi:2-haloacid dehalogenase
VVALLVFDVLGTMVDEAGGLRRGIRTLAPDVGPARVEELVARWQGYVAAQQRDMLEGRRPYAASTVLDLEAAALVAAEVGRQGRDAVRALAAASQRLDPWPDSVGGLARLAAAYPVAGLSNASRAALAAISDHAGLRWRHTLSGEDAETYKPHPDVYRLAVAAAACPPGEVLMVAAHAWDLRGAQAVGMRTAYVARPVGDPPHADDTFDFHAEGLHDLADQLEVG